MVLTYFHLEVVLAVVTVQAMSLQVRQYFRHFMHSITCNPCSKSLLLIMEETEVQGDAGHSVKIPQPVRNKARIQTCTCFFILCCWVMTGIRQWQQKPATGAESGADTLWEGHSTLNVHLAYKQGQQCLVHGYCEHQGAHVLKRVWHGESIQD